MVAALAVAGAARAERIRTFDVHVDVHTDGTFTVEERIRWDFEGAIRHGIHRDVPIAYARPGAPDFHVHVDLARATDAHGTPWPTQTTESGGYARIRIGDPDRTVTGEQDYWIRYGVRRGLLFFPDHDELYWNATGTEWPVPIDAVTATVTLPAVGDQATTVACYTGAAGSRERACDGRREGTTITWRTTRPLGTREGLTVAVGFPKGLVAEPSAAERVLGRLLDAGVGWILLPLATLATLFVAWRRVGRDPTIGQAIAVRYEPPPGLTPAEIGTLFDERADLDDVTSTILDLAIRGWVTITEVPRSQLLFFSTTDYRLARRSDPAGQSLKSHESTLLEGLFENDRREVLVSDLREKFYRHLPGVRRALYDELTRGGGYFAGNPDRIRQAYGVVAFLVGSVAFIAFAAFGLVAVAALIATAIIIALFGRAMPRRTRKGREAYEQILGLREFIGRVEADRLDRLGGRTATTFEKILPIAIVLGVADRWAEAFAGIYATPPSWYQGQFSSNGFEPRDLVRNVGRSLDTMGRAVASTPAGSGSSGSGGGGSSGGGFGGGGGGSW